MDEIMVSICCITYNHEKYIAEAIESFLMQKTNFKFEVLIHDDASTDDTAKIIREYEEKYPNIIKPIYQVKNQYSQGKIVSSNNYNRAKGKYIAICEGDDYWIDPYKLQKQFDYMERNLTCGLCFHSVVIFDDVAKKNIGQISAYKNECEVRVEDIILGGGGFIGTNSIFCRSELLKKIPKFYKISPVGDYPLQILTSSNKYAYFFKEVMSVYRTNISGSWTSNLFNDEKSKEKKILLNKKLINMLLEFDNYSNKKYENVILKKIKEFEFENLFLNDSLGEIKSKKYEENYRKLSFKKKFKLHVGYYFPKETEFLLKKYRKLKSMIKGY